MPLRFHMPSVVDHFFHPLRWQAVLVIACTAGMLLGGVYIATRRLPATWQKSLATCEVDEIVPRLRRLVEMSPDGLERVTESLGSKREEVALGAVKVLDEYLTRWEHSPTYFARRNVSVVAAGMAEGISHYSPTIQDEAAKLAKRILRWPTDPRASNRVLLVSYCDAILQGAAKEPKPTQLALYESRRNRQLPEKTKSASANHPLVESIAFEIPGGGLPIDLHTAGSESTTSIEGQSAEEGSGAKIMHRDPHEVTTLSPRRFKSHDAASVVETDEHLSAEPHPLAGHGDRPTSQPNRPARLHVDSDLLTKLWNEPRELTSFELLRLAQTGDDATSRRAWKEVQAREIPPKFLELGLHLTNPDPVVRRRWAQRLPSLPGIDAGPWLLALSDDEDADVRMTALVLMATTGDPRLLRRIEQLARNDREPQIQDQARRILAADRRDRQ